MAAHLQDGVSVFERKSSYGTFYRLERQQVENQDNHMWLVCQIDKKSKKSVVLYQSPSEAEAPPRHGWEFDEETLDAFKSPAPDVSVRCIVNVNAGALLIT